MSVELKYLHAFASIPSVAGKTLRRIASSFPSFADAWRADDGELRRALADERALTAILWKRPSTDPDREMETLARNGIWIVRESDPDYPAILAEIPHPPFLLYGRGRPQAFSADLPIAVVGTRKPTSYGVEAARAISRGLAEAGALIISGLAYGIDALAHRAAVEAGAPTIAVLGSGVDELALYPPAHRGLAREICDTGGAVVSEFPPGAAALREHFPQRNRIISGLSRGIVVVEAKEKSGALLTARFALEQNRDVFAVPGSVFSDSSKGPHALIKEGAKLSETAEDILKEYGIAYTSEGRGREPLGETENRIIEFLSEPRSVHDLKTLTGLNTHAIIAALSLLELKNRVTKINSETYTRIS